VQAVEEILFIINWRDDVTTAHVVRYRGKLYDISRVDCFEGYRGEVGLYCKVKIE
jgi:SPP1 family predicted phage head-tail adaptor